MEGILNREDSKIERLKKTNEEYIKDLERFLDITSNVKDKDLQERIIFQMLRCDRTLTQMTEKLCEDYNGNNE